MEKKKRDSIDLELSENLIRALMKSEDINQSLANLRFAAFIGEKMTYDGPKPHFSHISEERMHLDTCITIGHIGGRHEQISCGDLSIADLKDSEDLRPVCCLLNNYEYTVLDVEHTLASRGEVDLEKVRKYMDECELRYFMVS